MATSGSVTTASANNSKFYVDWERTSYSESSNYSLVEWKAGLQISGGAYWYSNAVQIKTLKINGTTVLSGGVYSNISGNGKHQLASGKIKIYHNDDGTKTFNISITGWLYENGNLTKSQNFTLDTIPRYATPTFTLDNLTETGVTVTWSTDRAIDHIWYSVSDGSTWIDKGDATGSTGGTFTIGDLTPNTLYNVKVKVRAQASQLEKASSRVQATTYDYPYCTETPDFVIGEALTLKFYNPLSRTMNVYLISNNVQIATSWDIQTTQFRGFNTDTVLDQLYATIPNQARANYKVKVVYSSSSERIADNGNTISVDTHLDAPTFRDFAYRDSNSTITAVTGNNQILVKGKSTLEVVINSANKMVAKEGASPKDYRAWIDTLYATANHSTSDIVIPLGVVNSAGSPRLQVMALDSRGCDTSVYKNITVLDYAKPVINVSVTRLNNFEDQTTIKVNGTYTKLEINNSNKNTINSVQYRYRETGGEWSNYANITTTVTNGTFTCNDVTISLDNSKAFEIEVKVTDKLDNNTASGAVNAGKAIFFISDSEEACYINDQKILMYELVNSTLKSIILEEDYKWDTSSILMGETSLNQVIEDIQNNEVIKNISQDINRSDLDEFTDKLVIGYGHNLVNAVNDSTLNLGHLISIPRHDVTGYVTQYFSPLGTNDLYIRKCEAGSWGEWISLTPKEVVLYDNEDGTAGDVTLSQSSANFNYIEIFYKNGAQDFSYNSTKIYQPDGKEANLTVMYDNGSNFYIYCDNVHISGSTMTRDTLTRWRLNTSPTITRSELDQVFITRVVGYN